MHEVGMLYQTAKIAEKYAKDNNFETVDSIQIEVGELSGALPDIFTEYFDYVARQYKCLTGTKLNIRTIPGEGLCLDCHALYNVMDNEGKCPRCASKNKKILGGTEIKLISITGACTF